MSVDLVVLVRSQNIGYAVRRIASRQWTTVQPPRPILYVVVCRIMSAYCGRRTHFSVQLIVAGLFI
jgi:hypothetical protein